MWFKVFLILGGIIIGLVVIVFLSESTLDHAITGRVDELLANAIPQFDRVFRKDDLEGLPKPVQSYLTNALAEGQPYVTSVRLKQSGEFRLGDTTTPWKPFSAFQNFTVNSPGFIWDATIEMIPLVPVRVVDMYKEGEGTLEAKILSAIPVVDAEPSPEMNSGELMRYLAETVWFPSALLPGEGVEWLPIDENSARATLNHNGTTVSLVFYFNNQNEVEHVFAESRFREVEGTFEPTPWTGHFRNYQVRNGMLIPIDGEVAWNLPGGDLIYWRGHLEEIEYQLAD
jgi:hypothetical protein